MGRDAGKLDRERSKLRQRPNSSLILWARELGFRTSQSSAMVLPGRHDSQACPGQKDLVNLKRTTEARKQLPSEGVTEVSGI